MRSTRLYSLKGELHYGVNQGRTFERYRHKFTDSGRLGYFVE
ncbi:hypothetical protein [Nocardia sp. NPDC052112]